MEDMASWPTGRLLSTAARLVEHQFAARLADHGLTMAGFVALHVLDEHGLTQRELATRCQVEEQTMSRTLERLQRGGLVERRRDSSDRRRMIVIATPQGRRTVVQASDMAAAERLVLASVESPELFRRQVVQLVESLTAARWPSAEARTDAGARAYPETS